MKKGLLTHFLLIIVVGFILSPEVSIAFWGTKIITKTAIKLGKVTGALPEEKIVELSRMIKKAGDVQDVNKILGRMNLADEILEDAFVRIAIYNNRISKIEGEKIFVNLRRTEGFRSTLSKINGVNPLQLKGHLNELRIANNAAENGFDVLAIGKKFDDSIKRNLTDMDIIIKKNNKIFAVEAKDWEQILPDNLITIRKDMDSLVSYKQNIDKNTNMIFSFTNKPTDPSVAKIIEAEANKRGINIIYGDPESQIYQIDMLVSILK